MTPAQNTQAYIQGFEDGERATKVKMLREIEWVELTDEEREAIANSTIRIHGQEWAYATAIEAKLREKNS